MIARIFQSMDEREQQTQRLNTSPEKRRGRDFPEMIARAKHYTRRTLHLECLGGGEALRRPR